MAKQAEGTLGWNLAEFGTFIFVDHSRWSGKSMPKWWTGSTGRQKKGQEKDNNSRFYADPESLHVRQVAKKKTTNRAFTLIRKVITFDGSPKKRQQLALLRWSGKWTHSRGRQKKRRQLALLRWSGKSTRWTGHQKKDNNSRFYADPESEHVREVTKKDSNSHFYADPEGQHVQVVAKKKTSTRAFTLIRKVNTVDGSPKKEDKKKTTTRAFILVILEIRVSTALKFLTIVERMANNSWTGPATTALSRSLKVRPTWKGPETTTSLIIQKFTCATVISPLLVVKKRELRIQL